MNPLNAVYIAIMLVALWPLADLVVLDRLAGVAECQSMSGYQRDKCWINEAERDQQRNSIIRSLLL